MNGIFFFDLQQDFPFLKYKSVYLFDEPYNFKICDTIIVVLWLQAIYNSHQHPLDETHLDENQEVFTPVHQQVELIQ